MSRIVVEFDAKRKKFVLTCPFHQNGVVKGFPAKRFNMKAKNWDITACRQNVDEMKRLLAGGHIIVDAKVVAELEKITIKSEPPEAVPMPAGFQFKTEAMGHQFDYLQGFHAAKISAVFAEMGTGKSKMACDRAALLHFRKCIDGMIIFCPVSVRSNWVDEIRGHLPIDLGKWKYDGEQWHNSSVFVADFSSTTAERKFEKFLTSDSEFKVLIVGTESLSQGAGKGKAYNAVMRFAQAVRSAQTVDEAHQIKGEDSTRALNVVELGKLSEYKAVMTGTPILQSVLDMFMYFKYLDPMVIGLDDFYSFKNRYALLSDDGFNRIVGYDNLEELMTAVRPHVFTCLKADVLKNLPPKTYTTIDVELTKEQREAYNDIKKKKLWTNGTVEVEIKNALQKYSAMQTIVSGFINYDDVEKTALAESSKMIRSRQVLCDHTNAPKIVAMVEFLKTAPHKACIIWSRYDYEIDMAMAALQLAFGDGCAVKFTGALKAGVARDAAKNDFLSGKHKYFVANQATGGVGLTLNVADLTLYLSNTFRLLDRVQSEDRNHRKGQESNVLYADFLARGTVDRDIITAIREKKDLADWVRDRMSSCEPMAIF